MITKDIVELSESELESVIGGSISDVWKGMGDTLPKTLGLDIPDMARGYKSMLSCNENYVVKARHVRLGSIVGRVMGVSMWLAVGFVAGRVSVNPKERILKIRKKLKERLKFA